MDEAIRSAIKQDDAVIDRLAGQVRNLLAGFPMPGFAPHP
jgi:glycine hydroxymethyltransferase